MQRKNRLSRSRDFDAVYRHGRSASPRFLTLHWFERSADDEGGEPRLGLAVPRAAGNAVVRNRIKRIFRELFRKAKGRFGVPLDVVVVPDNRAGPQDGTTYARVFEDFVSRRLQPGRRGAS